MKIRGNTVGTTIKPERVLLRCENLTPEEQAQARENIGAVSAEVIGSIALELDSIMNLQEDYIGGGVS